MKRKDRPPLQHDLAIYKWAGAFMLLSLLILGVACWLSIEGHYIADAELLRIGGLVGFLACLEAILIFAGESLPAEIRYRNLAGRVSAVTTVKSFISTFRSSVVLTDTPPPRFARTA